MRPLRDRLPLLAILLLALVWRLLLWSQPLHRPANDEVEYVQVARDLLSGQGWVFYESWRWLRAPLYPLFLAGSLGLASISPTLSTAEVVHLAALPNLILSVVLVYLIYLLTRELTPGGHEGPALAAAAVAAGLQTYATFASLYMSETLFGVLFTAGLLILARWRRTGGLWRAALAGSLLGLACLTRSAALVFLPAVAGWMVWLVARVEGGSWTRALAAPALLALGAAAVITPWTLRNCRAYEACILIETGGSYNLWAFYEPRESLDEINRTLEAITSPIARAQEATQQGLARLREDPTIIVRKLPAEWTRLWVVKPIQDRFLLTSAYNDPPPALFLSGLLLDDLLYLLVLCGAPFGLALAIARRDATGLLLGLWVGVFVGATMFTHAEGRYRHFLFMALIPLAAVAYDRLCYSGPQQALALAPPDPLRLRSGQTSAAPRERASAPRQNLAGPESELARAGQGGHTPAQTDVSTEQHHGRLTVPTLLAATVALALALVPALRFYPWEWAGSGALRSINRGAGDLMVRWGRDEAAVRAYTAALAADETPDGWIALGDLWRRRGDLEQAAAAYERAHRAQPTYVGASAVLGDLLRETGHEEAARDAFRGRYLDQQRLADWSYQMLRPAPRAAIEVGDGLDFGYVGGFYTAEEQQGALARWTDGRGRLRLTPADRATQLLVTLRVAAPRPNGAPVTLQVCLGGTCQAVEPGPAWRTVRVLLPAAAEPLELRSPTFLAPDGRVLGVLVDWGRVERVGWRAGERESGRVRL